MKRRRSAALAGAAVLFMTVALAVKHLVLCRIERRPPRLDLDIYPYLPKALVETTRPANYMSLMPGAAA